MIVLHRCGCFSRQVHLAGPKASRLYRRTGAWIHDALTPKSGASPTRPRSTCATMTAISWTPSKSNRGVRNAQIIHGCFAVDAGRMQRQLECHSPSRDGIEDNATLSVDAKQQFLISNTRTDASGKTQQVLCTEPSPDALVCAEFMLAASGSLDRVLGGSKDISAALSLALSRVEVRSVHLSGCVHKRFN